MKCSALADAALVVDDLERQVLHVGGLGRSDQFLQLLDLSTFDGRTIERHHAP